MVTAVAFDYGGVLTYSAFDGVAGYERELGIPEDGLVRYFRDDPMMGRLEVGEITAREYFRHVCVDAEATYGPRIDLHRLVASAELAQRLNPEMIALVEEVGLRVPVALVTNNVAGASWRAEFPYELFTVVLDSSELGVRKPDPRIYAELLTRLDRAPDAVAFVDDLARNTDAAAALGIRPVLFTGVADCRAALVRLGALAN
jgi:putative hydrolase of the HAD superfamily